MREAFGENRPSVNGKRGLSNELDVFTRDVLLLFVPNETFEDDHKFVVAFENGLDLAAIEFGLVAELAAYVHAERNDTERAHRE